MPIVPYCGVARNLVCSERQRPIAEIDSAALFTYVIATGSKTTAENTLFHRNAPGGPISLDGDTRQAKLSEPMPASLNDCGTPISMMIRDTFGRGPPLTSPKLNHCPGFKLLMSVLGFN